MMAYPDGTSKRIKQLSDTVTAGANNEMRLQKAEGCGSLPTAFQSLVEAKKIFLYTGANSGDGVPQIDGPLGAAILAHALYQANKVCNHRRRPHQYSCCTKDPASGQPGACRAHPLCRGQRGQRHTGQSNGCPYRQTQKTEILLREIRRYVDKIPLDSTSVWLCCTHFPALKKFI